MVLQTDQSAGMRMESWRKHRRANLERGQDMRIARCWEYDVRGRPTKTRHTVSYAALFTMLTAPIMISNDSYRLGSLRGFSYLFLSSRFL